MPVLDLAVTVWMGVEVAASPAQEQPAREEHDQDADERLRGAPERVRQVGVEEHDREAEDGQGRSVAEPPGQAEPTGAAGPVLGLRGDQHRDGGEVIWVGGMPQTEQQHASTTTSAPPCASSVTFIDQNIGPPLRRQPPQPRQAGRTRCPVVRREELGRENPEAAVLQQSGSHVEEAPVLEDATDHAPGAMPTGQGARVRRGRGDSVVEASGDGRHLDAPLEIAEQRADHGAGVHHDRPAAVLGHGKRIGRAVGGIGGRLELDRRLSLVVHLGTDAAERGHCVEQTPGARGERRGHAGADELTDLPPGRRVDHSVEASRRRRRRLVEGCREPGACHAPGLPDRRLAARHPHREEQAHALEALEVAEQELPAPDRAVVSVAGAVEDRADRGSGLAVLREAGRQVGVVVLTSISSTPSRSCAYLVERYSGWRSCATASGATANSRSKCSIPVANEVNVS